MWSGSQCLLCQWWVLGWELELEQRAEEQQDNGQPMKPS